MTNDAPAQASVEAVNRIAEFLKERDESVLPEEIDDAERKASAEEILRLASRPAPAADGQRVKDAVEAEREACAVLVDTMARYANKSSLLDDLHKVSDAIRGRASLATDKEG